MCGGEAREAAEKRVAVVVAVAQADEHVRRVPDARRVKRLEQIVERVRVNVRRRALIPCAIAGVAAFVENPIFIVMAKRLSW